MRSWRSRSLLLQWLALAIVVLVLALLPESLSLRSTSGINGQSRGHEPERKPIYIGALLPSAVQSKWRLRERIAPAIRQAIQDVNKNTSVLSAYVLSIAISEAEVSRRITNA